ncbi:uncharacterized protein LOC130667168 [Microplitis mediator]|uniref:uncharacterized protein LOC130667168 n=1 Tax=Microplitis mediator TaxID=375433 RepID=UPI0025541667|nr:uncharacterized protein LOC130667168 [Microplitis mediator]
MEKMMPMKKKMTMKKRMDENETLPVQNNSLDKIFDKPESSDENALFKANLYESEDTLQDAASEMRKITATEKLKTPDNNGNGPVTETIETQLSDEERSSYGREKTDQHTITITDKKKIECINGSSSITETSVNEQLNEKNSILHT